MPTRRSVSAALTALSIGLAGPITTRASESASPASGVFPPDPHAILAAVGKVVSNNGVDEARAVSIGGIPQWITVRGRDRNNPILLVLHGGPAAPDLPQSYLYARGWEDYFTVVQWDQRGAGKTLALSDPKQLERTLTGDRLVQDAVELTDYLRHTYGREKIFVLGHSWGSYLGLRLAMARPAWLYAYIAAGQIIDFVAQERVGYAWVLARAKSAGECAGDPRTGSDRAVSRPRRRRPARQDRRRAAVVGPLRRPDARLVELRRLGRRREAVARLLGR